MKTTMKKLIPISIIAVLALALLVVSGTVLADDDEKPAPKLECTITYVWMPGWAGTIYGDIGGTDGAYVVWPGGSMRFAGQTSHYSGERAFEIWDMDPVLYPDDAVLLMVGDTSTGSTTVRHGKNSNWRTSGIVTEAYGEFEDWIGRRVYQEGHFTWQNIGTPEEPIIVPKDGSGTFRVN
ncbi:MAG: hypothetical protein ACYSU3_13690 [Planctomycetota bacterium]|jgi:hypothetical protein